MKTGKTTNNTFSRKKLTEKNVFTYYRPMPIWHLGPAVLDLESQFNINYHNGKTYICGKRAKEKTMLKLSNVLVKGQHFTR